MFNPILRRLMLVGCLLMVGLMSLISLSVNIPLQAAEGMTAAPSVDAERRADEAMSLYWAASARLLDQNGGRESALALALEANRISNPPDQAVRALEDIAYAPGPRHRIANYSYSYGAGLSAAFSPDGKQIVTTRGDGQLMLIDLATGTPLQTFCCQYDGGIIDIQFSPDQSKMMSYSVYVGGDVGYQPLLVMWDVKTGKRLWPEDGTYIGDFGASYDSPIFSQTGNSIIANDGHNHLISRDANTGKEIRRYSGKAADELAGTIAFSPDNSKIASGTKAGDVIIWDAQTAHQLTRFSQPNHPISAVAFSPDGTHILTANENGSIRLWDITTGGNQDFYYVDEKSGSVRKLTFNADGKSFYSVTSFGELAHWDIESDEALDVIQTRGTILDISPDRQSFLVKSASGWLELWDVKQGQEAQRYFGHQSGITSLAFSPSGEQFTSADQDGKLIVWNKDSPTPIYQLTGHASRVNEVVYSPDGNMIASLGENGVIFLWDATTGKQIRQFNASANGLNFSPDGLSLLTAGSKDQLIQWDVSSGRETHRYTEKNTTHNWLSAVYSRDGRLILSLDKRNAVLWDVGSGTVIRQFEVGRYAALSPDGQTIIFEDQNHNMVFADTITGQEIRHIDSSKFVTKTDWSEFYPYYVVFSPDGKRFLTSDWYGLKVWDIQTGEVIRRFALVGDWAVFSPDGRFILTKTDDLGDPFIALYGHDVLLLRLDSSDELMQWTLANRAVGTLTCDQRAYYRIPPLCNAHEAGTGTPPATFPFITSTPSLTITSTPTTDLNRTTATPTATFTPPLPSLTPTANQATLAVQSSATAAITATRRSAKNLTATIEALTPSPTINPNYDAVVGSQRDTLDPPKWKVWHYQGTAGEVVTISVTGDKASDNQDNEVLDHPYFVLHGPDGALLETVNDIHTGREVDSLLENYVLPSTGIYEIEIRSRGVSSGSYTLRIEVWGIRPLTPIPSGTQKPTTTGQPTFDVATLTAQAATDQAALDATESSIQQTITAQKSVLEQATITLTASPTPR